MNNTYISSDRCAWAKHSPQPRRPSLWTPVLLGAALSCGTSHPTTRPRVAGAAATPAPAWVNSLDVEGNLLCGGGVAGAGFSNDSPWPKRLAQERAIYNLAGVLGTQVQEAIVDRATGSRTNVRMARALIVDEALVKQVGDLAETDFWLDEAGTGPYAAKAFTYARACIDTSKAADVFHLDSSSIARIQRTQRGTKRLPAWIRQDGPQPGGRLCAVGFSLPTFHPDKTFQGVVEDVRSQLAEVIRTLVSSYYEERTSTRGQAIEAMTVASTEAISKGALVTDYWYDRDGIGPMGHKRSTYGWGCVYPIEVFRRSAEAAREQVPAAEENAVAEVKERAEKAFELLEKETEKHERRDEPAESTEPPPTQAASTQATANEGTPGRGTP